MSNLGKWDPFYAEASANPVAYGDSWSYRAGAARLEGCPRVEDWGCGLGWFRQFLPESVDYVGVDGSWSPHADVVDDLVTRSTEVDGIFMRGILEHNYDWPDLLANALRSFTQRFVLVTFTPFTEQTPHEELQFEEAYGVPTLALNHDVLVAHFEGFLWEEATLPSPETFYGTETIFTVDPPF